MDCNVYLRDDLTHSQKITGPCVIEENNSVTLLHPNQKTIVDEYGNLIINVNWKIRRSYEIKCRPNHPAGYK